MMQCALIFEVVRLRTSQSIQATLQTRRWVSLENVRVLESFTNQVGLGSVQRLWVKTLTRSGLNNENASTQNQLEIMTIHELILQSFKNAPCSHDLLRHNESKPLYAIKCHLDYIYRPSVNSFSAAYSFFLLDYFQAASSSISPTGCLHKSFSALWFAYNNLFSLVPISSSSVEAGARLNQCSTRDTWANSRSIKHAYSTGCVFRKEIIVTPDINYFKGLNEWLRFKIDCIAQLWARYGWTTLEDRIRSFAAVPQKCWTVHWCTFQFASLLDIIGVS